MVRPTDNLKLIIEMYYSKFELASQDIKELFNGCSDSSVDKLKKVARKQMVEDGAIPWDSRCVVTASAFKAWHINIDEIEKRALKISTLKKRLNNA
jgi:hypothetical protein